MSKQWNDSDYDWEAHTLVSIYDWDKLVHVANSNLDDDVEFDIFDFSGADGYNQNPPKIPSKIWHGIIKASYIGFNEIDQVTKYVLDVVAVDCDAARQIITGIYNKEIASKYPILDSLSIVRERDYDYNSDKDKRPRVVDKLPGMYGGYRT